MADHYSKTIELLQDLDDARADLAKLLRTPKSVTGPNGPLRPTPVQSQIEATRHAIRDLMKLAEIHSNLAVRQELQEIATGLQVGGLGVRL